MCRRHNTYMQVYAVVYAYDILYNADIGIYSNE